MIKVVKYKNKEYNIEYTRITEKCMNGKTTHILSIIMNGACVRKFEWDSKEETLEQMKAYIKQLIDDYVKECNKLESKTDFELWDGDLT